jgi:formylglycine-generating enzyme required for sulfatase activity
MNVFSDAELKLRASTVSAALAVAFVTIGEAALFPSFQATAKPDPTEIAAVEKIRARIEERAAKMDGATAAAYRVTIPNTTVTYGMAPVPAGEFQMGSSAAHAPPDERPPHRVRVDAFWMQTHEVTWDSYLMFMFADQSGELEAPDALVDALSRPTAPHLEMSFGRGNAGSPAISMTQHAANKYAQWLSARTSEYYRLPTEAEWEYACRAGTDTDVAGSLDDYAWYAENSATPTFSDGTYHQVGTKKPNAWGLHDMLGNVMEWTLDQYAPYTDTPKVNPWVRATEPYPHAVRGGSWNDEAARVTCTARVASHPTWKMRDPQLPKSVWYMTDAQWLGFRLVRPATLPSAEEMYRAWNSGVELDPF